MTWGLDDLFALLALVLVLEGLLPAISPNLWRKMLLRFTSFNDYTIRVMGVVCMVAGAALLAIVHNADTLMGRIAQLANTF